MRRDVLVTHLLDAGRLPVLSDDASWTVESDGPEDTRTVGACQKTSLESIGAVSAVRRSYAASSGQATLGSAHEVVARFADDKSAWRAHQVLRSWREDCEERLAFEREQIGPLESVVVRVGTGDSYRTSFGPKSVRRGSAGGLGIVRTGRYLAIVEITTSPGDYPSRRDPAHVAVRRISRTFA